MKEEMKCRYDESPYFCLQCPFSDCINDNITDDPFFEEEPPKETDNSAELYEDIYGEKQGKRKYTKYKGTYWDDRRHKTAREYSHRKRYGIPKEPITPLKKGREIEYQREYRAQMPPEQRERYLAWQREYNRKKRARKKQEV